MLSILDANCISVNRVESLLADQGTLRGDLDGIEGVAFADFLRLALNYGTSPAFYTDGDVDRDGTVGFPDFLILSANFSQGGDFSGGAVAVPEPSGVLPMLVAISLRLRLWRQHD